MYISLATLDDPELVNTIETAIGCADNPNDLSIGIAYMSGHDFYAEKSQELSRYPQVTQKWFDPRENAGIGIGRANSRFAYNGEDRILQVDPHTLFEDGWDSYVLNLYDEALEETQNEKTILTAYLNRYSTKNGTREILGRHARYSFFVKGDYFYSHVGFYGWSDCELKDVIQTDEKFLPSIKICANFSLGNEHFAEFSGLHKTAVFHDEEILQSVRLVGNGFSLVYPNVELPMTHLYALFQGDERRGMAVDTLFISEPHPRAVGEKVFLKRMGDHYQEFVNDPNNLAECLAFQEYAHYGMRTGMLDPMYIPKEYSR